MATLYRKYRPQSFADIVGQEHVTKTLQAALVKQRVAHAYLFYGARGTGKTTTARVLAAGLGAAGLNVIEIDAASNRGIDDIRSLREAVALSPTQGKYKVYIIDEVHMLTKEAFAALLKTLEEPVKHAVFILATTELHKVPATIVSRCQVYRFKRASDGEMKQRLSWILQQEKREMSEEALAFVIARSDGCYRDAESLVGQVLTWREGAVETQDLAEFLGLPERELLEKFLGGMAAGEARQALAVIDEMHSAGLDPDQFLHEAIRLARDVVVDLAQGKSVAHFEAGAALTRLPIIIRALLTAIQDLAYVPEPKIALQLAVLSVAQTPAPSAHPSVSLKLDHPPLLKGRKIEKRGEDVEKVQKVWDQLIQNVKAKNPVASTFLRAVHPIERKGGTVTVRVQYALHRNFFEKPENKKLVDEELGKLLGGEVDVRYQLEEAAITPGIAVAPASAASAVAAKQEEELYQTVKEVFAPE